MAAAGPLAVGPDGCLLLQVRVVPRAAREGMAGLLGPRLEVRVAAPPAGGAAHAALLALLGARLGVAARALRLAAGAGSPLETVAVGGVGLPGAQRALGLPGAPARPGLQGCA